jgi:hypothetical protein
MPACFNIHGSDVAMSDRVEIDRDLRKVDFGAAGCRPSQGRRRK